MASSSTTKFLCLFLILGLASPSLATEHVVGDLLGWNLLVDFNAWASARVFKVGDTLRFNYLPLVHNVVRLPNEASLLNCITDTKLFIDGSGSTSFALNQIGDFYFCSSLFTDCLLNLKMKVSVVA
ncbi:PREDICTED: blue copper protein-like [Ipomoea nil]|uniref:blue copper protein-like n=1 Tax=Ipomoea nil TaxID=35883 RepID=UPI0009016513|nr:PREDICTED: blue copper protein-like [Ipomoea nil]